MNLVERLKLVLQEPVKSNDYLLDYSYLSVEPLFNKNRWVAGILANGVFRDRKFGHIHTQQFHIPLADDDCIFAIGQQKEFVDEAFARIAKEKLEKSNHLKQVRKSIDTALAIQAGIIAGGVSIVAVLLSFWIW